MAKITKKIQAPKETIIKTPKKTIEKPTTKEEILEYHLNRIQGNYVTKQECKAIFASLFR